MTLWDAIAFLQEPNSIPANYKRQTQRDTEEGRSFSCSQARPARRFRPVALQSQHAIISPCCVFQASNLQALRAQERGVCRSSRSQRGLSQPHASPSTGAPANTGDNNAAICGVQHGIGEVSRDAKEGDFWHQSQTPSVISFSKRKPDSASASPLAQPAAYNSGDASTERQKPAGGFVL